MTAYCNCLFNLLVLLSVVQLLYDSSNNGANGQKEVTLKLHTEAHLDIYCARIQVYKTKGLRVGRGREYEVTQEGESMRERDQEGKG